MQDGQAGHGHGGQGAVGVVDGVADGAHVQVIAQLAGDQADAVVLALRGGSAQVGGKDGVLDAHQGRHREVRDVSAQSAGLQGFLDGLGVHQGVAGVVDEGRALLHLGQGGFVHHGTGALGQRYVQGDIVGLAEHFAQVRAVLNRAGQGPSVLHGDVGVIAQHLHAQSIAGVGYHDADGSKTDDAQGLAGNLGADELLLALFHQLGKVRVSGVFLRPGDALGHPAGGHEQGGDHQLLDSVGVGAGGVKDHHTLLGHLVQGDVVDAHAGAADAQKLVLNVHLVHVGAADDDGVRLFDFRADQVLVPRQNVAVDRGNGVQIADLIHGHLFSVSNFLRKSHRALTPATGMAL